MSDDAKYIAIEIFYTHLSKRFPERFLVTGSFANQAWLGTTPRPINDLDLLETQLFDSEVLKSDIQVAISDLKDVHGIVWLKDSLTQTTIFEESNVPGVRSNIEFTYKDENHSLQIDTAKQDPLTQAPVTVFIPSRLTGVLKIKTVLRLGPMPAASAERPLPLALKRPVRGLEGLAKLLRPEERLAIAMSFARRFVKLMLPPESEPNLIIG